MKTLVVLCLLICVVSSSPTKSEWQKFKETYRKQYLTTAEEDIRHHIFTRNLKKIKEHNKQYELGHTSFKMGVNKYSDLTEAEFKKMLGYKPNGDAVFMFKEVNYQEEWENFKLAHKRVYTKEEDQFRFKIFSKNLAMILKHNEDYKKGLTTFKMGVNNFSDMTAEEMKKLMGTHLHTQPPVNPGSVAKDCVLEWGKFKENYARIFTESEDKMRFTIFCNKFHMIQKHNEDYKKGLTTFKMEINRFADRTTEEMKQMMGYLDKHTGLAQDLYESEWSKFKQMFGKSYTSKEEQHRYQVFRNNLDDILKHNERYEKGLETFKMAINKFSDLAHEEFQDLLKHGL